MTVQDLFRVLELAIHDGHGDARILFDTEAKAFNYHMAEIGSAYVEPPEASPDGKAYVSLHEKRHYDK